MEDTMAEEVKEFDQDAVINPSSGIYARNPTRVELTNRAEDQDEIVKAIKGARRTKQTVRLTYEDKKQPPALPGVIHLRKMEEPAIIRLCQSLMRMKPNIFKIHIKLGNYENQQAVHNGKTRDLGANKQRFYTEIGSIMGSILADRTLNVTELVYTVHDVNPGLFNASGEVYGGVSDEDYDNDKLFDPIIEIVYFPNS